MTVGVAPLRGGGDRQVHRRFEVVPGCLLVGDADRPGDGCVRRRDLGDDLAGRVVTVDAEPRRLSGDRSVGVFEAVGRDGKGPRQLGPEEEAVGAVADSGDADRRVDGD